MAGSSVCHIRPLVPKAVNRSDGEKVEQDFNKYACFEKMKRKYLHPSLGMRHELWFE